MSLSSPRVVAIAPSELTASATATDSNDTVNRESGRAMLAIATAT
ncbi:MAG: hypothetical protein ABSF89_16165 [Acidimicrobiales bacterium]|jgi:hypothetical protein